MIRNQPIRGQQRRRGVLVPIVAFALVAVMGGIALVLDRMWLDMARLEMRTSAEAAALAAARELVNDDLLRSQATNDRRIVNARTKAKLVAAQNLVAGTPLELKTDPDGDVRVGRLQVLPGTSATKFFETIENPNTAVVVARRVKNRNNPVALLINGISPSDSADVLMTAEATINNQISGIRPLPGLTAPVWPLAVLDNDPSGKNKNTWQNQIDNRLGSDQYGVDDQTGAVQMLPDGIPEITLSFDATNGNACWLPFRSAQADKDLPRMITKGISEQDLSICGGAIVPGPQLILDGMRQGPGTVEGACRQRLGLCQACLLYSPDSTEKELRCGRLVAARIVNCSTDATGKLTLTLQPGVMETRTALPSAGTSIASAGNPYIYHLSLTQ